MNSAFRAATLVLAITLFSMLAFAQQTEPSEAAGGPFSDEVIGAPFSATAVSILREPTPDGTIREQTLTARYYRDSNGRVRAEFDKPSGPSVILWIPGAERGEFYALDTKRRTYRVAGRFAANALFNGEGRAAVPVGDVCFRRTPPVSGASDIERLQAVKAEVSAELGIVLTSHRADDVASVDYHLKNVSRGEPRAELFTIPAEYAFVEGSRFDPLIEFAPWAAKAQCVGHTR